VTNVLGIGRKRSLVAKDLRTPKYKMRIVTDRKKKLNKNFCRKKREGINT
jgi:hypothetical protein